MGRRPPLWATGPHPFPNSHSSPHLWAAFCCRSLASQVLADLTSLNAGSISWEWGKSPEVVSPRAAAFSPSLQLLRALFERPGMTWGGKWRILGLLYRDSFLVPLVLATLVHFQWPPSSPFYLAFWDLVKKKIDLLYHFHKQPYLFSPVCRTFITSLTLKAFDMGAPNLMQLENSLLMWTNAFLLICFPNSYLSIPDFSSHGTCTSKKYYFWILIVASSMFLIGLSFSRAEISSNLEFSSELKAVKSTYPKKQLWSAKKSLRKGQATKCKHCHELFMSVSKLLNSGCV